MGQFTVERHIMLRLPEAAEEIRMSEGYLKKEIREGRLVARKFGRFTRIERSVLEAWIARQPVRIVGTSSDSGQTPTEKDSNQVIEKTVSVR